LTRANRSRPGGRRGHVPPVGEVRLGAGRVLPTLRSPHDASRPHEAASREAASPPRASTLLPRSCSPHGGPQCPGKVAPRLRPDGAPPCRSVEPPGLEIRGWRGLRGEPRTEKGLYPSSWPPPGAPPPGGGLDAVEGNVSSTASSQAQDSLPLPTTCSAGTARTRLEGSRNSPLLSSYGGHHPRGGHPPPDSTTMSFPIPPDAGSGAPS